MTLKENFDKKLRLELKEKLNLDNINSTPNITKIVVNMGVGRNRENKSFIEEALRDMKAITGQHPSQRQAKKSISNFKIRKGDLAGITVTLRGKRMWDFYEKLVRIVLPSVKDFRGLNPKSFDGKGNYSFGLSEHIVFPEVDPNKIVHIKPMQITITTSTIDDKISLELLKGLEMPFYLGGKNG